MRTVFASLPPLLDRARDDLGLSAGVAGLLTTGPVLCFGLFAPAAPRLVRRVSAEWVVVACASATAAGAAVRGFGTFAALLLGAVIAGTAVAVAQAVLPIMMRVRFGGHVGSLTGAFSMSLTLGAALAAATAVPLANALGDSWEAALAVFAVPAALAAAVWTWPATTRATLVDRQTPLGILRDRRAWSIALYFGFQSMAFYAGLTWLPSILQDEGYSEAAAGGLLALSSGAQVVPAFLVPVLASRRRDQSALLVGMAVVAAAALAGVAVAPGAAIVWMTVIGLAQGGCLGLALMLPMLRGGSAHAGASLTAMALSVGYLVASVGPWLVGLAHDVSGGWGVPVAVLVVITLTEIAVGLPATRPWRIGER
jgi:CP family cyanate transporter-like MFS transporter